MRRFHLSELEDQEWCPDIIRESIVDTLRVATHFFGFYREVPAVLLRIFRQTGDRKIVDLCSGGGGPWESLHKSFTSGEDPYQIYLTDINPNHAVLSQLQEETNGRVKFIEKSVSALSFPQELDGFRTLFTCFHHFKPEQAQQVLADAVDNGQGIAIFEFTRRHPLSILMMFSAVVGPLFFVPFMRPFRWSRIVLTYLLPVIPLAALWDGVVSCLRSYTEEELQEMTEAFAGSGYQWEVGRLKAGYSPFRLTYLVGYPMAQSSEESLAS
jgi:hypothetical protein